MGEFSEVPPRATEQKLRAISHSAVDDRRESEAEDEPADTRRERNISSLAKEGAKARHRWLRFVVVLVDK